MSQRINLYETAFIVNASLEDMQIDAVIEKVKETITKNGGTIRELAKWGRKRFAYSIKKKNNGFYIVCEFNAPTDAVAKLERHYLLDENILRFLTILVDPKAGPGRISVADLSGASSKEPAAPDAAATQPATKVM